MKQRAGPVVDRINLHILEVLQRDGNLAPERIAQVLHLHPNTVRRRIERLEQSGVMRRSVAVSPASVGLHETAIVMISCALGTTRIRDEATHKLVEVATLERIAKEIRNLLTPEHPIFEIHTISGQFDIMLKVRGRSASDILKFVMKDIGRIEGVRKTETFIVAHTELDTQTIPLKV